MCAGFAHADEQAPAGGARRAAFEAEIAKGFDLDYKKASYDAGRRRLTLAGDVRLATKDGAKVQVFADGLVAWGDVDPKGELVGTPEIYAEGNVFLVVLGDSFEADWVYVDLATGEGRLERATLRSAGEPRSTSTILARAEHARVEDGLRTFAGEGAELSTCTYHEPHYALTARSIRVERRERSEIAREEEGEPEEARIEIERPGIEVYGVPVFLYPWSVTWDTAWNRFVPRVRVGKSGRFGYFMLNELPVYPGRELDVAGKVDLMQRRGVGLGGHADWSGPAGDRELYRGFFDGYYVSDRAATDRSTREPVPERDRWRIRGFHRDDLPFGFRREAEVSAISDRAFLPEFYEREAKTGKEQETVLYGRWLRENMGATVLGRWRLNDFQTEVEHLPRGRWSWIGEPFLGSVLPGGRGLYLTTGWELANERLRFDEETLVPSRRLLRADLENRLDYPFPVGPIEVDPFGLARYSAWSSRGSGSGLPFSERFGNAAEGGAIDRLVAGAGAIATTDLWRDFGGVRHIATPSVGYSNVFTSDTDPEALVQIDAVEAVRESEFVPFGVRNRIQMWRGAGEAAVAADVVDWNVSARVFPRPHQNDGDRLGVVRSDLRLNPVGWAGARWRSDWDPNAGGGLVQTDAEASFAPDPAFRLGAGYRYFENLYRAVEGAAEVRVTEKWGFLGSSQYDFERHRFTHQRVSVRRFFHRFVLELSIDADFGERDVRFAATFLPIELFRSGRGPFGNDVERSVDPLF